MLRYPLSVTLDTNIFDAAKYDFDQNSVLSLLIEYVEKGKIQIVLSDIVIQEAKKHIAQQTNNIFTFAKRIKKEIYKSFPSQIVSYLELDRLLEFSKEKGEQEKLKSQRINCFDELLRKTNAEILKFDSVDLEKVINDYFMINPPFESNGMKRKEFPDAFIASQIRNRFGEEETVAIISRDKGFISACKKTSNHLFFDSLGDLYNLINEQEESYKETIEIIDELKRYISLSISEFIINNDNIDVNGLSYDKDGIESGFDYDEYYMEKISNTSFSVWSVDEMLEQTSLVTLQCCANIIADCYYKDYDNAPWDSEEKEYLYVDTINVREKHNAKFGCRIELNRKEKSIKIFPFTVILGEDSREERHIVDDSPTVNYVQELYDMDRKELGLRSLSDYESYLEEDLSNSELEQDVVQKFEEIKSIYKAFEDISICYDSLLEKLHTENVNDIAVQLSCKLKDISDFPVIHNKEQITEDEIYNIRQWCENKYEESERINESCLPDTISFGETIIIQGLNYEKLLFTINKIEISPTEGDEETIDISISSTKEQIGQGYIKLTVGYLHLDDEGQIGDGLEDSIEYEYSEIIDVLCDFIKEQNAILNQEKDIFDIIESIVNSYR